VKEGIGIRRHLKKSTLFYKDNNILVKKAPEPSDIIWDNLHFAGATLLHRIRFITAWILTFFFLITFFLFNMRYKKLKFDVTLILILLNRDMMFIQMSFLKLFLII
jgi:hypothetical protein